MDLVRRCFETVAPVLERSSDHLASLAANARLASPHEAGRAAQLAGVAVRLLQAARRIRLAQQLALIESGRLRKSLRPERFDLAAAVGEVVRRLKSLFAATGVDLACPAVETPTEVVADRERVLLVIRDLLEVCLAMTAAGGRVEVALAPAGDGAELTVSDTGVGMTRQELAGIFSSSGSPPVHEDYTGGIRDGLFVAREVVEACGGHMRAESVSGRGTRFSVVLPPAGGGSA
jgi:signal transduction histidine kinase